MPKIHFRSQGKVKMPMVIRIPFGGGIGAVEHHSESPEAQFAHTPGLKVVACSNPIDGYWMIQQAIACDDPVIFLEPKRQYHADKAELDESETLETVAPLFSSRVVRQGTDVTEPWRDTGLSMRGPIVADLDYMLEHGHSFSIYMAHGGTSFGLWAGAASSAHYYADAVRLVREAKDGDAL